MIQNAPNHCTAEIGSPNKILAEISANKISESIRTPTNPGEK